MNKKKEIIKFTKFILVGFLGAIVGGGIITYATGKLPPDAHPLAYIVPYLISVEAGILVTFYPNDVWVFREQEYRLSMWQRLVAYHGALFSGFIVQTMVLVFFLIAIPPSCSGDYHSPAARLVTPLHLLQHLPQSHCQARLSQPLH